jgi:hypothetical protein
MEKERESVIDLVRRYRQWPPRRDGRVPTDDDIWQSWVDARERSAQRRAREPKEPFNPGKSSDYLFKEREKQIEAERASESARSHAFLAHEAYERRLQPSSRFGGQRKKDTEPRRKRRSSSKASRNSKRKRSNSSRAVKNKRKRRSSRT